MREPASSPSSSHCSAARALELLGDRWTLLLIREVVFGTRRFDDFAVHLGIARNVLSTRLGKLVESGILMQVPLQAEGKRHGYQLTPMGEDLLPVLLALMQWGDRWLQTPATVPIVIVERSSGKELPALRVRDHSGKPLARQDLDWVPGPGAGHPCIAPLVAAYESQRRQAPRPVPKAAKAPNVSATSAKPRGPGSASAGRKAVRT